MLANTVWILFVQYHNEACAAAGIQHVPREHPQHSIGMKMLRTQNTGFLHRKVFQDPHEGQVAWRVNIIAWHPDELIRNPVAPRGRDEPEEANVDVRFRRQVVIRSVVLPGIAWPGILLTRSDDRPKTSVVWESQYNAAAPRHPIWHLLVRLRHTPCVPGVLKSADTRGLRPDRTGGDSREKH